MKAIFPQFRSKLSPQKIILFLMASWLSASALINWVNQSTPSYFTLRYAGLEGSLSLLLVWIFFALAFFVILSNRSGVKDNIDSIGRLLFFSWLLFSSSMVSQMNSTSALTMLAIFNLMALLLARDILRSAFKTGRLIDLMLSLGGLTLIVFNLILVPWLNLLTDISERLAVDPELLVAYVIAYLGLCLMIGWLLHRDIEIFKKNWFIPLIMLMVALLQIFLLGRILAARYQSLSTPSYDFNLFAQMFHNMAETGRPVTTLERNMPLSHFKVHFSPIFYLLLPAYLLMRDPVVLNVAQGFIVASGIIPMVLIAKHFEFSKKLQFAFCLMYLVSTAFITSNFYDLHENVFLVPLLFWLIWAIEKNTKLGLILFTLLTLMIKEDAALYIWALAAFILLDRKMIREGITMFLASGIWFILAVSYLNTFGDGAMTGRYESLIAIPSLSLLAVPYAVWRNPGFILSQIFQPSKLSYFIQMLAPLGFMPLLHRKLSPWVLLIPFLLMNLMVDYPFQSDMRFQYNYGSYTLLFYMAMLFIAGYVSPERSKDSRPPKTPRQPIFSKRTQPKDQDKGETHKTDLKEVQPVFSRKMSLVPRILIILAIASGSLFSWYHLKEYEEYPRDLIENREELANMKAAMDRIPKDASVLASSFLTGYLYERETLYDVTYNLTWDSYYPADYIVLDLRPYYEIDQDHFLSRFLNDSYETQVHLDQQIIILKKTHK